MIHYLCTQCQNAPIENKDTGLCSTCGRAQRKDWAEEMYVLLKPAYLKMLDKVGYECPRCGKPVDPSFDIHHKAGRVGYADKWAKEMDIPKLVDVRFFLAMDRECHQFIETHPNFAKARGWSLPRTVYLKSPIPREDLVEIWFSYKQAINPDTNG